MARTNAQSAADIMRKGLVCCEPDQTLDEVEQLLVARHITGLPVVVEGRLVGVISRSDLVRVRVLAQNLDSQVADELNWDETQADGFRHAAPEKFEGFRQRFHTLRVKDVMRSQVVTCTPKTALADVAGLMLRHKIHRVIVVEDDRPVGIISSLDLVELLTDSRKA